MELIIAPLLKSGVKAGGRERRLAAGAAPPEQHAVQGCFPEAKDQPVLKCHHSLIPEGEKRNLAGEVHLQGTAGPARLLLLLR